VELTALASVAEDEATLKGMTNPPSSKKLAKTAAIDEGADEIAGIVLAEEIGADGAAIS